MLEVFSLDDINILQQGQPPPEAVELAPPIDDETSTVYYEALEGMLVQVSNPAVAVSPTSRYGEYSVVLLEHAVDRIWRGADTGHIIMVDDGTSDVHHDSSTLDYAVQTGDQLSDLYGPLAYTFGHYKIEPLHPPKIIKSSITLEELPPTGEDEFSIMTWNVENLFDILDPHPVDPPLPRKAEYELSLTKIANTILAGGVPTIVSLQEVEHLGILEDLSAHVLLSKFDYMPVLVEGTDSRGIDVGYLVRGDRAEILDTQQHVAPEGLTSRPPLLIQVQIGSPQGSVQVYLINNHFTSMAGGVLATEPRRSAQAAWNVTILEEVLAQVPEAYVAVLGDLNSFLDSNPIEVLKEAGLEHVFDIVEPDVRYTYIFEGASQSLDHILVTSNLMDLIKGVEILHTNADYPPADPDDPSPIHKSDHDPVIATFRFPSE
jgi:predicted extracellular nuclease